MRKYVINFIKKIGKAVTKDKKFLILVGVCILIVVFLGIKKWDNYFLNNESDIFDLSDDTNSIDLTEDTNETIENGTINEDEESGEDEENLDSLEITDSNICIYITGEVNNSGVFYIKEGSRIIDAINLAGGTTPAANLSKINLAYVLEDGMKINIPNNNDLKKEEEFNFITRASADTDKDITYSKDNSENDNTIPKTSQIVNINTASQTELETLPGIGPSLALKIIEYRKQNGKFSSIEGLKEVSGIGDSKFDAIKDLVTVK